MRLFLLVLVLATPYVYAQPAGGLVGEWRLTGSTPAVSPSSDELAPTDMAALFRFVFAEDGSVLIEAGGEVAYTFDGSTLGLALLPDGGFEHLEAGIAGDTLTMTDLDDGAPLVFMRDGGAEADGILGRWIRPGVDAQMTNGAPTGLEFAADGMARVFYSSTLRYTVEGGALSLGSPLESVGTVDVTGDRMTLAQTTRVSTYARWAGVASAMPVVVLERTACFGYCPMYTLAAYADGRVVWTGIRNVETLGTADRQVPPALVAELVAMAEAAGFAGLPEFLASEDVCEAFALDQPGTVTTVRTAAGTHTVRHNYGCLGFRGEAALMDFETAIDRALGTSAWGGGPPTVGPR